MTNFLFCVSYNGLANEEKHMHYVIYPDILFLENFICNMCFLFLMKSFFFPDAAGKRLFLAGTMTALCNTLASVLFFHCIWILQIGVLFPAAGLMVVSCLNIREPRRVLYLLYQMTLWTLVFGGIVQGLQQWTDISVTLLCASAVLFAFFFGIAERLFTYYKRQNECMREIVLYYQGKSCHFRGFADTGNQLFDPVSKKPVSIVSEEAWELLRKDSTQSVLFYPIPYSSVGNPGGMLQGIGIDFMVIRQGRNSRIIERPVIAITKQPFAGIFHYSVLLHNEYC